MDCCSNKMCAIFHKVILVLLCITEIAAVVGVYKAHMISAGATFGSTPGSMAILAFALNTAVLIKYTYLHCSGTCGMEKK